MSLKLHIWLCCPKCIFHVLHIQGRFEKITLAISDHVNYIKHSHLFGSGPFFIFFFFQGGFVVSWLNSSTSLKPSLVFKPSWLLFSCCMKLRSSAIYVIFTPSTQLQFASRLIFNNRYGITDCIDTTPASEQSFFWKARWESKSFVHAPFSIIIFHNRAVIAVGWMVFWNPPFPALQVSHRVCAAAEKQKRFIYWCYAFTQWQPRVSGPSRRVHVEVFILCCVVLLSLCGLQYLHFVHFCDLFASTCSHLRPSHC